MLDRGIHSAEWKTYTIVLQFDFTSVRLLVRSPGTQGDQGDDDDGEKAASNTGVQAWSVSWCVLSSTHSQCSGLREK
jgi:hypothetical protein